MLQAASCFTMNFTLNDKEKTMFFMMLLMKLLQAFFHHPAGGPRFMLGDEFGNFLEPSPQPTQGQTFMPFNINFGFGG